MKLKVLVQVTGFIGDIIFASSAAKLLKEKYEKVLYRIRFWEPYELLQLNPFIDGVFVSESIFGNSNPLMDTFICGEVDQNIPVTIQFQRICGIEQPILEYQVYTNKIYDGIAENYVAQLKSQTHKKIVAYQANWNERTFGFTKEEYERGIDIPPLGYGGRRRATGRVLAELANKYTLVEVGLPNGAPNGNMGVFCTPTYSMTASLIKNCDWMIGGEGGLTNLAAGVGTKTIITGDFIHQLYGPNGCIKKIQEPKMGPKTYFPNVGHITLDPFLTDDEVVNKITEIIG